MPSALRLRVLLSACLVAVVVLSGCSVQRPGRGTPAPAVLRAAAQDPTQLLEASETGLGDLSGFEVAGTLDIGGTTAQVDLQLSYAGGHGTVTAAGTTEVIDLGGIVTGDETGHDPSGLFITAPARYWERQGVDADDAARYDGRQVSIPRSSPLASGASLLTRKELVTALFQFLGETSTASVTASPPVDGQDAWVVDSGGEPGSRLTVQIAGQQFPLRLVSPHATVTFSHFGTEPAAHIPAAIGLSLPG